MNLTTLLDLAGSLLIVAAAAVALAPISVALALAVSGAGVLGLSWTIDRANRKGSR